MSQTKQIIIKEKYIEAFCNDLKQWDCDKALLVCSARVIESEIGQAFINSKKIKSIFSEFEPNPSYDSAVIGVKQFLNHSCDSIIAIGGGSTIDVAKSIKAYVTMSESNEYVKQQIKENNIPFYVMPTTAGTGSEATKFAVLYYKGEKISVDHESLIPHMVFMNSTVLKTLPLYQKKATMLDAYCHCVESMWARCANCESRTYAMQALKLIRENADMYLEGDEWAGEQMLIAANLAGKAINISKTTAAHAMCYKITKLYGISHGHAAALCLLQVMKNTYEIVKGDEDLELLGTISQALGMRSIERGITEFRMWLEQLNMNTESLKQANDRFVNFTMDDIELLTDSVNVERLSNHPVAFTRDDLRYMYRKILGEEL